MERKGFRALEVIEDGSIRVTTQAGSVYQLSQDLEGMRIRLLQISAGWLAAMHLEPAAANTVLLRDPPNNWKRSPND